jgi:phosphatidylinositol-3-phosphatase
VIVLENRELDEVIGSPEAPFVNYLAGRGALAVNYYAVSHPSLPNYLALLGGSTFGIAENCSDCLVEGPNLATQLSRAGISWKAYMGGMPSPCYLGDDVGQYAKRHNPFVYFPSITALPKRCARIVPDSELWADLERHRLPAFAWLTPDLCRDAHDCRFDAADYYLSLLVPRLMRQLGPHGLLVLTFDEGTSDSGGGGWIATILAGPHVPHGIEISRVANHYSLLGSLEDRFGLPRLGLAVYARALAPALFEASD